MPSVSEDWLLLLRKAMAERGWTQNELARQLETDSAVVSRWFTGKQRPGVEFGLRIETLLGVPLSMMVAA